MDIKVILSKPLKELRKHPLILNLSAILATVFISSFLLEFFQRSCNFWSAVWWVMANPDNFFLGAFFILCVYLFILSLLGNLWSSSFFCLIIFSILGYSNTQKMSKLGEPLYPVDFYNLRYVKSFAEIIASNISISFIIVAVLVLSISFYLLRKLPKITVRALYRVIMFTVASFFIYSYLTYNKNFMKVVVNKAHINIVLWNQPYNYAYNGFVFGMLSNLQNEVIEKPADYSKEKIEAIADKYVKEAERINAARTKTPAVKPNIIYILSETFWDPTRLNNLTFSEDPLKNMRGIQAKSSSGWLLSPAFGGETANVEFETLTGLSIYNLIPGAIPYQQALDKKKFFPSIVSQLEEQNYDTVAIHPYNRVFYKRDKVYNAFGFNSFLSDINMKHTDTLGGKYISDQAVVDEMMDLLAEKKVPTFIHAVTMQNHYPFTDGKFGTNTISISGLKDENKNELETYTEGIKWTDKAINNLIDRLSTFKEPTVVVFYGDHLPGLSKEIYEQGGLDKADPNEKERAYSETPLFIYSNYGLKQQNLQTISPAFLTTKLFDMLGEPITPFQAMLEDIRQQLPGLKRSVQINSSNNINTQMSQSEEEILKEYKLIEYDLLVGEGYSLPILFKN